MSVDVTIEVECNFCGQTHIERVEVPEDRVRELISGRLEEYSIANVSQEYECGHPIDGGRCSREVGGPDERCWQHEDST